jgi:hypothetical protein
MIKDGFDVLTYRYQCHRDEPRFIRRRAELDGRWVEYLLHDQPVRLLKGKLRLRQIRACAATAISAGDHQPIGPERLRGRYRLFERSRQESLFGYMREEFLLDALVDYRIEPEDPTRTVPNPSAALWIRSSMARADLTRLEREYGAAAARFARSDADQMQAYGQ